MEARVHKHLSSLLAQHSLQDAVSNIDDIVLSYLLGILDLISQGEVEDCFDLEDVMDMMNAYLPGFDEIDRSSVMEWMFSLAADLTESESTDAASVDNDEAAGEDEEVTEEKPKNHIPPQRQSSFPLYDYNNTTDSMDAGNGETYGKGSYKEKNHVKTMFSEPKPDSIASSGNANKPVTTTESPAVNSSLSHSKEHDKDQKSSTHRRKKRYLSCSSQDSQEDSSKSQVEIQAEIDDCLVKKLLDMFPAACSMEAKHCLHASSGDLNVAAQLIMDRQDIGQSITESQVAKNNRKSKKVSDYKLDDDSIKSCVIEKYSFYDVAEDEKTHKPPPLKNEAKKLVRYRDGQIVSMKGERFSEIKKT